MNVVVYSRTGCQQCIATCRALGRRGIGYERVDVETTPGVAAEVEALGYTSLPVVVAGAETWAGFRPDRIAQLSSTP